MIKRYTIEIKAGNILTTFIRQFRGTHKAPILLLKLFFKSEKKILATGSSDFSVKVWDMNAQFCTHNFPGKSSVSSLCFVNNGHKILIGYNEGQVRMFDLTNKAKNQRLTVEWNNHTRFFFKHLFNFFKNLVVLFQFLLVLLKTQLFSMVL